jgi:hypothetical protein
LGPSNCKFYFVQMKEPVRARPSDISLSTLSVP